MDPERFSRFPWKPLDLNSGSLNTSIEQSVEDSPTDTITLRYAIYRSFFRIICAIREIAERGVCRLMTF